MRIGIVGGGVVGRATARCYLEWAEVRVFDVRLDRATHSLGEVLGTDLIFLCLPTGELPDTPAVDRFAAAIAGTQTPLVLRSTVPIGKTRWLRSQYRLPNLMHHPEFLTARTADTDAQLPARLVVGGDCPARAALVSLLSRRFPGVQQILCTSDESEMIKLATNSFFAAKIAFFNEINALCESADLNWQVVVAGILSDGRISHSHTRVPGPDGKFGFGGECLPKDLGCLVHELRSRGLPAEMAAGALRRNQWDRQERQCKP